MLLDIEDYVRYLSIHTNCVPGYGAGGAGILSFPMKTAWPTSRSKSGGLRALLSFRFGGIGVTLVDSVNIVSSVLGVLPNASGGCRVGGEGMSR